MDHHDTFHQQLKELMDEYAHLVYRITKTFPADERYGVTSQLRRSSLSVILNYIEGYARIKSGIHKHFLEISYGSLQESKYLLDFSYKERYMPVEAFQKANEMAERIGRMLWGVLRNM